jgi:hypothetical protein
MNAGAIQRFFNYQLSIALTLFSNSSPDLLLRL